VAAAECRYFSEGSMRKLAAQQGCASSRRRKEVRTGTGSWRWLRPEVGERPLYRGAATASQTSA
jgi:hypothetical protein